MKQSLTCILCPAGCELQVDVPETAGELNVTGNGCPRGREYAVQEVTAPVRNIATSVAVQGGELPLCSVRLSAPIPKEQIFAAVEAIHAARLTAPVRAGQVVLADLLGLGVNVITTRTVAAAGRG